MQTGLIIGFTVGLLSGAGVGLLGSALSEMLPGDPATHLSPLLTSPLWTALLGAMLGIIAGGLIGSTVDYTLTRLGAGPPLPAQETLVTVRTDEGELDAVYAALFRNHARHLHVSTAAI